ncbi:putative Heat shock protein 90 [Fasciola hepatica]|uniref:Heat shock protein 90 n=1 Tax=Fasciola hepatica TaxID=6192 RepID=A0A4E0QTX4_FASHE|nr:putative Heat shock protein 90 [Fasciola hepatica]
MSFMRFSWTFSRLVCRSVGIRAQANLSTAIKFKYGRVSKAHNSLLSMPLKCLATAQSVSKEDKVHSRGPTVKKKFQAETQKLLDIVAKSLYSEKEVFVRELVSNASDAIERLRFQNASQTAAADQPQNPMEIRIRTDKSKKLLIIEDTGIGMTREEMEDNLGTIARSGSREFVAGLKNQDQIVNNTDIIGQFGVGFYATFMVANKVEVFSRSQSGDKTSTVGYRWSSTGHDGEFEMCEMQDVPPGTKIVLHLKDDALEFADDEVIDKILRKYSNFVTAPIFLNDRRVNVIEPTWLKDPAKVRPL